MLEARLIADERRRIAAEHDRLHQIVRQCRQRLEEINVRYSRDLDDRETGS
jgi:hypothetical protein